MFELGPAVVVWAGSAWRGLGLCCLDWARAVCAVCGYVLPGLGQCCLAWVCVVYTWSVLSGPVGRSRLPSSRPGPVAWRAGHLWIDVLISSDHATGPGNDKPADSSTDPPHIQKTHDDALTFTSSSVTVGKYMRVHLLPRARMSPFSLCRAGI